MNQYGSQYAAQQYSQAATQPLIEVDGKLSFGLPGSPVFTSLGTNTILKPTLLWRVRAPSAGKGDAELSYVSGGMSWKADYNIVGDEKDSKIDVIGWVTIDNQTGKTLENARIQLMAGDVNKRPPDSFERLDGVRLPQAAVAPTPQRRPSPNATSTNITSTHSITKPCCSIVKPSKWNSCGRMTRSPPLYTSTKAR